MWDLLLSPNGRVNRAAFWKGAFILVGLAIVVMVAAFALAKVIPGDATADGSYHVQGVAAIPHLTLIFGYLAFPTWSGICLGIKRFHDRNKPGAWVLIQFVPFVGPIWYFIEAGCLAGTPGPNAYGLSPIDGATGSVATVF